MCRLDRALPAAAGAGAREARACRRAACTACCAWRARLRIWNWRTRAVRRSDRDVAHLAEALQLRRASTDHRRRASRRSLAAAARDRRERVTCSARSMWSTACLMRSSGQSARPPLAGITPVLPLKPCERVVVERVLALRDTRSPGGLVARPSEHRRCRRHDRPTQAVSYAAVPSAGSAAAAVAGPALSILSAELSWPATATRATGCRRCFDALDVARIGGDLLALVVGADVAREGEQADGHGKQNAENEAEIVEEMASLVCSWARSISVSVSE